MPDDLTPSRGCTVPGCERPHKARGYCEHHYYKWWRTGTLPAGSPPPTPNEPFSAEDRFMSFVHRSDSGCWEWTGSTSYKGYAKFRQDGERMPAHRWAYEHWVGPIPEGLHIDHLCRNRKCVNPEHLEPVTPRENVMRGNGVPARNARKTHCVHGHPFSGDNLRISLRGDRRCRECYRIRLEKLRAKKATAKAA